MQSMYSVSRLPSPDRGQNVNPNLFTPKFHLFATYISSPRRGCTALRHGDVNSRPVFVFRVIVVGVALLWVALQSSFSSEGADINDVLKPNFWHPLPHLDGFHIDSTLLAQVLVVHMPVTDRGSCRFTGFTLEY